MPGVLFWGSRRLLSGSDKGIRKVLKRFGLGDLPVVGRGAYSVVVGADSTVFKLTIDQSAYDLAAKQMHWRCTALPRVEGLHGIVGDSDLGMPIHLLEVERLEKPPLGSATRKRCMKLAYHFKRLTGTDEDAYARVKKVLENQPQRELVEGMELLSTFVEERFPSVAWDLHLANFMQRPGSEDIVVTDPFMDIDTRSRVLRKHVERLGGDVIIV